MYQGHPELGEPELQFRAAYCWLGVGAGQPVHKEVREAAAIALAQVTINSCSDSLKSDRVEGASAAIHIAVQS
jgi:hypothetical protein